MNKKSSSTIDRSYIKEEEFKIKYDTISNSLFHHKKVVKTSVGKRLQPSTEKKTKSTLEMNHASIKRLNKLLNKNTPLHDKIKQLDPEKIAGAIAIASSVVTASLIPIIIYKGYKVYKYSKRLSENLSETNLENKLLELSKKTASTTTQKLAEEEINTISNKIIKSSEDIGLIRFISDNSKYDESAIKILFKSTLDDTFNNGLCKATNFAVEAVS